MLTKRDVKADSYTRQKLKLCVKSFFDNSPVVHQLHNQIPANSWCTTHGILGAVCCWFKNCIFKFFTWKEDTNDRPRVKLSKHMLLGTNIRHLTRSKQLVEKSETEEYHVTMIWQSRLALKFGRVEPVLAVSGERQCFLIVQKSKTQAKRNINVIL